MQRTSRGKKMLLSTADFVIFYSTTSTQVLTTLFCQMLFLFNFNFFKFVLYDQIDRNHNYDLRNKIRPHEHCGRVLRHKT